MGKFVFRLQPIYNLKIQMEEIAKNKLNRALGELRRRQQKLISLHNDKNACINELAEKYSHGVTSHVLKIYNSYIFQLDVKITMQKENIKFAQKNVDKVREELIRASQEKEMFEKLREKKYADFLNDLLKSEQRLADEIVCYKENTIRLESAKKA
jgi:flagellar FliJ protein